MQLNEGKAEKPEYASGSALRDIRKFRSIVRRLERELNYGTKTNFKCCGMTHGQCRLLIEIGENPGLSSGILALNLNIDKSTLSRTGGALMKKGLIYQEAASDDRRSIKLYLTADGCKKHREINSLCDAYYRNFLQSSGFESIEGLIDETEAFTDKLCDYNSKTKGCFTRPRQ